MSWQRLVHKSVFSTPNKMLLFDIGAYLERCYLGDTIILNRRPFINIRSISANPEAIHYELSSMQKTAQATGRNYYQSFWVKDVERLSTVMDRPVIMSRTWLQPRAYDSLHWLSLFQIYDDIHDRDKITSAAVSRWYPTEAELEKDATQLR